MLNMLIWIAVGASLGVCIDQLISMLGRQDQRARDDIVNPSVLSTRMPELPMRGALRAITESLPALGADYVYALRVNRPLTQRPGLEVHVLHRNTEIDLDTGAPLSLYSHEYCLGTFALYNRHATRSDVAKRTTRNAEEKRLKKMDLSASRLAAEIATDLENQLRYQLPIALPSLIEAPVDGSDRG